MQILQSFTIHVFILALLTFLVMLTSPLANAQPRSIEEAAYVEEDLSANTDNDAWERATRDLKFDGKNTEKKQAEEEEVVEDTSPIFDWGNSIFAGNWSAFFQVFFFLLVIGALVFFMVRIFGGAAFLSNKKVASEKIKYSIEQVEDNLQKADLEGFAQHAIQNQDYKLALRLYYLQIIKVLSRQKVIKWKRDKTNREYVREVQRNQSDYAVDFKQLTRLFERVWYSDISINQSQFQQFQPLFSAFLKKIA